MVNKLKMSKQTKRKITVNITPKSKLLTKNRPSVFERLGTKAGSSHKEFCHHWAQHGTCPYGKGCKYSSTHTLISPSKQRAAKKENESKKKHTKDGLHKRVHSSSVKVPGSPDEKWNHWDLTTLEDADPDDLEKRRQELQRELELQMKMENKARKKEKKAKRDSTPSSESTSSSSDSSSSSDESSSSSSSSVELVRHKKSKKVKSKRDSSSSSDREQARKHKIKTSKHSSNIKLSGRSEVKSKKSLISKTTTKIVTKSPSPPPISSKKSQTPPPKLKTFIPLKSEPSKSPRPSSSASGEQKEKHRTPSPKVSKEKEKEKSIRDKDKEREREKERERDREKEKEREKERERERAKEKEKERDKERDQKKREQKSPKRDSKGSKEPKRKESPDSCHSRDRKLSPSRSRGSGSGSSRRDNSRKNSPVAKDDRRIDKRDDYNKSRSKDRLSDKNRKPDKRDSRDRERDRERERRIAREEREAAREKEREEALARCQERQRERERLKELAKKEEERRRERNRRDDRGLDKPSDDRSERLLPLPNDRVPPGRRARTPDKERNDRERPRNIRRDRTPIHGRGGARKSLERPARVDRDIDRVPHDRERTDRGFDRNYDRSDRNFNRDAERDCNRDYSAIPPHLRDSERRHDEKRYDSPYERGRHDDRRYHDMDDHYNENSRNACMPLEGGDYPEDRRGHREGWGDVHEERDIEHDRNLDSRPYGHENSRPPFKERDWEGSDYANHEWDRGRRPLDWENRGGWDNRDHDHSQLDDEWRHYNNRPAENWNVEDRRRWPDWRERSRPHSATSHREEETTDSHKRELPKQESTDSAVPEVEVKKEVPSKKRPAEESPENVVEPKKACVKEVLEDDLSEISDDADDILNREEELADIPVEENLSVDSNTKLSEKEDIAPATIVLVPIQKLQSPNSTPTAIVKEDSIEDENMDLDFEEISEDELEEEMRVKGLGDALGVDWASLIAESRPCVKPICSAKRRWESHNVLVNMGISVEMAGEDLVKSILEEHAQAKIKEDLEEAEKERALKNLDNEKDIKHENSVNIKEEVCNDSDSNQANVAIKEEVIDDEIEDDAPKILEIQIEISHPIAAMQVALQEKAAIRKSLFASAGPFRRALSARHDLAVRRHLCNLPLQDAFLEAPKRHDPELLKQALQLFERSF